MKYECVFGRPETTVLSGDVTAAIGELKAKPGGELRVNGSGALVRWLLDNDLVGEMNAVIVPVVVGHGTRLLPAIGPETALNCSTRGPLRRGYRSRSTAPPRARSTRRPRPT